MTAPTALQRLVRRALLQRAKADSALTTLVPAGSIAPDGKPIWPFVLVESPRAGRLRASCVAGAVASFDLHAFAGPRQQNGSTVETGYDHASRIGAQLETTFAENVLTLGDGSTAKISISDMQMLKDDEPDSWHWFAQCNVRVLAEAA